MAQDILPSRRQFLTGRPLRPVAEFRPPWTDERSVTSRCTGCGDCIAACGERILEAGPGGLPRVHFQGGECTFCGDCAAACDEGVFLANLAEPWPVTVAMTGTCLLSAGIACRLCTDACTESALRFDLSVRPVGAIRIDADACTGCGACLSSCPSHSLALQDPRQGAA
jgi:ferredoxin-type protein NapF